MSEQCSIWLLRRRSSLPRCHFVFRIDVYTSSLSEPTTGDVEPEGWSTLRLYFGYDVAGDVVASSGEGSAGNFFSSIVYVTIRLRVSCMDPERPSFFSFLRFYLNRERREEKARHIIVSIFFALKY